MLITISLLILAYMIMGKDVKPLLGRVKNIDWCGKINVLIAKLCPWAFKTGCDCKARKDGKWQIYEIERQELVSDYVYIHIH